MLRSGDASPPPLERPKKAESDRDDILDAGTVINTSTTFTLQCGSVNNFIDLTTNDTLTATSIAALAFDVVCTN